MGKGKSMAGERDKRLAEKFRGISKRYCIFPAFKIGNENQKRGVKHEYRTS